MAEDTKPLTIHAERVSGHDRSLTLPAPYEGTVRIANPSINVRPTGFSRSEITSVPSQPTGISGYLVAVQTVQPQGDIPIQYRDPDLEEGKKYDKYIIVGLITTYFCCCLFGLCATYYAIQAKISAIYRKEEETALYTSRATTLVVWAVFTGFFLLFLFIYSSSG